MSIKVTQGEYRKRRLGISIAFILLITLILICWLQGTVLALNGDSEINLHVGDDYIEQGAHAIDKVDGDISNKVQISGNVDTHKPGIYFITYKVINSSGNKKQIQRQIVVEDVSENTNNTLAENINENTDNILLENIDTTPKESYYNELEAIEPTFVSAKITSYNKSLQNTDRLTFTVTVTMSDGTIYDVNHEEKVVGGQKGSKSFNYDIYVVYAAWNDNNTVTNCEIR